MKQATIYFSNEEQIGVNKANVICHPHFQMESETDHKENDICLVSLNEEVDTDEILKMTCMKKTRRVFGDLIGTKGKTFWQYAKKNYKYMIRATVETYPDTDKLIRKKTGFYGTVGKGDARTSSGDSGKTCLVV